MVGQHCEWSTLEEIPEVLDGGIDGEQLATERAVVPFCGGQFPGEERQRAPLTILMLLEHSTKGGRGGIDSNRGVCVRIRVHKECCVCKHCLDGIESRDTSVSPRKIGIACVGCMSKVV